MSGVLNDREVGQLPLSIGTSLAIESLLGIREEGENPPPYPPNVRSVHGVTSQGNFAPPPIFEFDELWVNLRTLARNAYGAVPTDKKMSIEEVDMFDLLLSEMSVINTEVRNIKPVRVVFYASDMDLSKYRLAKIRQVKTEKQMFFEKISANSIGLVFRHYRDNKVTEYELKHFKLKLEQDQKLKRAVILTNIALDLVSYPQFKELTLLESHTGAFKKRDLWYTKYYNGKEYPRIPFTEKFLQIFGDKECFHPLDKKAISDILAVAEKYKWTPLTTSDKIGYGIRTLKNQYLIDYYHKL